jgi:phytoene dehydrogenase-like protein
MTIEPSERLATRYDVVIVGGGHNGLVAANYLASAGQSVLLLERSPALGGATASCRIFPDYDARISRYSYLISLLPERILEELGLEFRTRQRPIASFTPFKDRAGNDDGLLVSNLDDGVSQGSFLRLTGTSSAWHRYQKMMDLQRVFAELVWPTLTRPLQTRASFTQQLSNDSLRQAWDWFVERPIGQMIENFIDDDLVRGLVMTDAKIGIFTHPHDPTLIQNRCFIYHVIGRGTGQWQVPIGGMGQLVDALAQRAEQHGATLVTGATVTAIDSDSKQRTVRFAIDGKTVDVDANRVLVNASPRVLDALTGRAHHPAECDEGSVVKVNMLLRRLPRLRASGIRPEDGFAGSLHIDEGYRQMQDSYRTAAAGNLPDPAPCEVYCHTLTDASILAPELAQQGYHTLTLFGLDVPHRLFAQDHDRRKAEIVARYLQGLDRICQEPFADCLAVDTAGRPCIEVKTPQELETEVGLDQGNIFHNALSWFFTDDDQQAGNWGVETDIPGVDVCGSSAKRGGAVSGIPGRNAAAKILQDLGRPLPEV